MPDLRSKDADAATAASSGRVIHDQRGNAIWNWAIDTVVLAKTSTLELLDTLSAPGQFGIEEPSVDPSIGWCGDPYNRVASRP